MSREGAGGAEDVLRRIDEGSSPWAILDVYPPAGPDQIRSAYLETIRWVDAHEFEWEHRCVREAYREALAGLQAEAAGGEDPTEDESPVEDEEAGAAHRQVGRDSRLAIGDWRAVEASAEARDDRRPRTIEERRSPGAPLPLELGRGSAPSPRSVLLLTALLAVTLVDVVVMDLRYAAIPTLVLLYALVVWGRK